MNGFTSCAYVERSIRKIQESAFRVGRDPQDVDVALGLITSVDEDEEVARSRVRPLIAMYLSRFPNIARETGYEDEFLAGVKKTVEEGGLKEGARLIPDEVIDDLAAVGTVEHVRSRVDEYRKAGVRCPVLFTVGPNLSETLESIVGA